MADKRPLSDKDAADVALRERIVVAVMAYGTEGDKAFPWNKANKLINYIETANPDGSVTK